jgi:hypothetical protein
MTESADLTVLIAGGGFFFVIVCGAVGALYWLMNLGR